MMLLAQDSKNLRRSLAGIAAKQPDAAKDGCHKCSQRLGILLFLGIITNKLCKPLEGVFPILVCSQVLQISNKARNGTLSSMTTGKITLLQPTAIPISCGI